MKKWCEPTQLHLDPEWDEAVFTAPFDPRLKHPLRLTTVALILAISAGGAGAASLLRQPAVQIAAAASSAAAPAKTSHKIEVIRAADPPPTPGPTELQAVLDKLAANFGEPVGIAITDVTDGWMVQVQGDNAFPQMSVSKLWVAMTVLDAVDRGELTMDTPLVMGEADRSVFNQPLSHLIDDDGFETTVQKLLRHAIVSSDNSANDKLISVVGVESVNRALAARQLKGIKLGADERNLQASIAGLTWEPSYGTYGMFERARAALPDDYRAQAMADYLANPLDGATPVGIAQALSALKRGELLSPASTQFMIDTMADVTTGPQRLKGGLPGGWTTSHKTGTGQDLENFTVGYNDVGLITAPDGRTYAVVVMIQKTKKPNPRRMELMQAVSRALVAQWRRDHGEG